jgi:two-component system, cell cycle response regulator
MRSLAFPLRGLPTPATFVRRLIEAPDPPLASAGVEGEWLVARVRLAAMLILLITPTWKLLIEPGNPVFQWGFAVTLLAAFAALLVWWTVRHGLWNQWLGFASSALDVSFVSAALFTFVFASGPLVALNSKVTFEIYFLAILATSLRYDARICVGVGLLAILEYLALWGFAVSHYDLADPSYAHGPGGYSAMDQLTRVLLLLAATVLAVAVVGRAQRLLHLAVRDRLTGLYNRGHFDVACAHEIARATRSGQPLSVALIDVDHFKRVNDAHGHAAGDKVLAEIAERLASGVRSTDVVARYGGEEFTILFVGSRVHDALVRLDGIREQLASSPLKLPSGEPLPVTFSAGIAGRPNGSTDTAGLLHQADACLLTAKRGGRNRVVSSWPVGV